MKFFEIVFCSKENIFGHRRDRISRYFLANVIVIKYLDTLIPVEKEPFIVRTSTIQMSYCSNHLSFKHSNFVIIVEVESDAVISKICDIFGVLKT